MRLIINSKPVDLDKQFTILELLEEKNINPSSVVVELNYAIPDRSKWKDILLKDGDNVEIVKFIGGG